MSRNPPPEHTHHIFADLFLSFLVTPSTYARLYRTAPTLVAMPLVERVITVSIFITTLRRVDGFACSIQTRTATPLISTSPMTMSGLSMGIRPLGIRILFGPDEPLAFTERVDSHGPYSLFLRRRESVSSSASFHVLRTYT